jgi:hypothetical protein
MKALLILAIAFVSLTGCAGMKFSHPSKDPNAGFKQDWTNCQVKMGQANVSSAGWGMNQRAFLQQCMEGEGWTRE